MVRYASGSTQRPFQGRPNRVQGFESPTHYIIKSGMYLNMVHSAQYHRPLVYRLGRLVFNQKAMGSTPIRVTKIDAIWQLMVTFSKSFVLTMSSIWQLTVTSANFYGSLAQLVEHFSHTEMRNGSNPLGPTISCIAICDIK